MAYVYKMTYESSLSLYLLHRYNTKWIYEVNANKTFNQWLSTCGLQPCDKPIAPKNIYVKIQDK